MKRKILMWVMAMLAVAVCCSAEITGKVVGISDGDTIVVLQNNQQYKIRLYGVDTPESHQDFGTRAKQFTSEMVFNKEVRVVPEATDKYGRTVGTVYIANVCINEELIKNGFAWVYRQYCSKPECQNWLQLEDEAKNGKKGLWNDKNPLPPWEFRKNGNATSEQVITKQTGTYSGNTKSGVFHKSSCRYYNCKNCTAVFGSRDEAIKAGYKPCKICKP